MSENTTGNPEGCEKGDCVCFTAGPRGALFSLGVIHAYLAADRPPPVIAAGVSVGALSAAAMHRSYREMREAPPGEKETARWKWFRGYVSFLVQRPLDVIWNSVPDISDLLAKRPPIRETAQPKKRWTPPEQGARLEYYLLVKALQFVSRIDVKLSQLAKMGLHYVRWREYYPDRPLPRLARYGSLGLLLAHAVTIAWRLCWTILLHPGFYWPWPYRMHIAAAERRTKGRAKGWRAKFLLFCKQFLPRPLFGRDWLWLGWMLAAPMSFLLVAAASWAAFEAFGVPLAQPLRNKWELCALIGVSLLSVTLSLLRIVRITRTDGKLGLAGQLMSRAELRASILTDFQLRLALEALFRHADGKSGMIGGEPDGVQTLLVASPLEAMKHDDRLQTQLYTQPGTRQRVADALAACLAVPPLLRPLPVPRQRFGMWMADPKQAAAFAHTGIHLIDGAQICANPVPPLFDQLKCWERGNDPEMHRKVRSLLAGHLTDFRVHLIHSSPIGGKEPKEPLDLPINGNLPPLPGSVESALKGIRLSKRRDAQLEVFQTNYQSEITLAMDKLATKRTEPGQRRMLPVLIDEIGPEQDLKVDNVLRPEESELLRHAAAGCRATLAVLNRETIGDKPIRCDALMRQIGVARYNPDTDAQPGLREICSHCTRIIRPAGRDIELAKGIPYTAMVKERYMPKAFLDAPSRAMPAVIANPGVTPGERVPRVVFVASGGVFRGAFHIGMVGAMHAIHLKPDLIVGASVGTLMGAALGELFTSGSSETLPRLVDTFIRVNDTVALTRQFKSAMRDLSTRAQMVNLSPKDIRRKILEGAGKDPAFATAGAPAELIDAISRLFLIPHRDTQQMAADFIAEDVAGAVSQFVKMLTEHTVERLGIRDSLLGTSLLELAFSRILENTAKKKDLPQPFLTAGAGGTLEGIGFLAMTVNLNTEMMEILGLQVEKQEHSYDFLQAALSSSAFPLAFPARRASQIYPRTGRRDVFYGDGGMFDNLPLVPAMMAISAGQLAPLKGKDARWDLFSERVAAPDLYVVGALDIDPSINPQIDYDRSILAIHQRASSLEKNMKTHRFARFVSRIDTTISGIAKTLEKRPDAVDDRHLNDVVNSFVHAGVMVTTPSGKEFLNGTFAFCESLNLRQETIRKSISDGCFRLLENVRNLQTPNPEKPEERAMAGLLKNGKVTRVSPGSGGADKPGICPFYAAGDNAGPLKCPFAANGHSHGNDIWEACVTSHPYSASSLYTPAPARPLAAAAAASHTGLPALQSSPPSPSPPPSPPTAPES